MRSEGFVILTHQIKQENNKWLARCIELGTSTFGSTFEEAAERLEEAVELHLNSLEEVGEIERFFRENGITFHPRRPKKNEVDLKCELEPGTFSSHYINPVHRELIGP